MFQKADKALITYREIGTGFDPPFTRGRYETLDYILISGRWRNSVQNVFSDFEAAVYSDHRPLLATIQIKFKAHRQSRQAPRQILGTITQEHKDQYAEALRNI
eukprot:12454353-Prorocentrum_lima.AAC.1